MALAFKAPAAAGLQTRRPVAARRVAPVSRRTAVTVRAGTPYPSNWLNKQPIVVAAAFLGWTIPSNVPVSAFGGQSLFGLFTSSIATNLANFPTGPSLDDPFWLYLLTWHIGLFLCLLLGQVGVNGRTQGYF